MITWLFVLSAFDWNSCLVGMIRRISESLTLRKYWFRGNLWRFFLFMADFICVLDWEWIGEWIFVFKRNWKSNERLYYRTYFRIEWAIRIIHPHKSNQKVNLVWKIWQMGVKKLFKMGKPWCEKAVYHLLMRTFRVKSSWCKPCWTLWIDLHEFIRGI